tara:strand:- start:125 stop:334 length:210 start_codon:yes stop_codon:yes gene_type:complete
MTEDFALSNTIEKHDFDPEIEALLEAARRATWDALYGPKHLRSGRYRPHISLKKTSQQEAETDKTSPQK